MPVALIGGLIATGVLAFYSWWQLDQINQENLRKQAALEEYRRNHTVNTSPYQPWEIEYVPPSVVVQPVAPESVVEIQDQVFFPWQSEVQEVDKLGWGTFPDIISSSYVSSPSLMMTISSLQIKVLDLFLLNEGLTVNQRHVISDDHYVVNENDNIPCVNVCDAAGPYKRIGDVAASSIVSLVTIEIAKTVIEGVLGGVSTTLVPEGYS